MKTRQKMIAAGLVILLTLPPAGCGKSPDFSFSEAAGSTEEIQPAPLPETGTEDDGKKEEEPRLICVYICGAVVSPGVYTLPEDARVFSLIEAAGGLTQEADERFINQAAVLTDGQQITVLTKEETAGRYDLPPAGSAEADSRIDINTADEKTLMTLPGIGEARAAAIIAYRQEHGPFERPEDIQNISGIKGAVYEKIADRIRTGP